MNESKVFFNLSNYKQLFTKKFLFVIAIFLLFFYAKIDFEMPFSETRKIPNDTIQKQPNNVQK